MKCKECGKGTITRRKVTDELDVGTTITLKIPGIEVEQCDHCDERYIDADNISKRRNQALAALVDHYSKTLEIPADVSNWMRQTASIPLKDWAALSGKAASTFTHAVKRGSPLTELSALALLALVIDFLKGSNLGTRAYKEVFAHMSELVVNQEIRSIKIESHHQSAAL